VSVTLPIAVFAAETITYKYDARSRLVEVKRTGTVNGNVQTNYTYDKANNRKTIVVTGSPNTPP
jgi:phage baseplate assembly protein W